MVIMKFLSTEGILNGANARYISDVSFRMEVGHIWMPLTLET
jgi:hypothetical protein